MKQTRKRRSNISREFRLPANVMHEEAWEDSGPNMKLSRAFIVVLVLHIVAVGGLAAFNLFDGKKAKVGEGSTNLPSQPLVPVTKQEGVEVLQPTLVPQKPVQLESSKTVRVEREMSTKLFALQYGLTEERLLELNQDTLLASGKLTRGETLFVPSNATKRSSMDDLPEAPVVLAPLDKPTSPEIAAVRQPKPRPSYTPAKQPTVQAKPKPKPASSLTHKVRSGDTLYGIATKNGVSVNALMRANGISNAKRLSIGKVLTIPK